MERPHWSPSKWLPALVCLRWERKWHKVNILQYCKLYILACQAISVKCELKGERRGRASRLNISQSNVAETTALNKLSFAESRRASMIRAQVAWSFLDASLARVVCDCEQTSKKRQILMYRITQNAIEFDINFTSSWKTYTTCTINVHNTQENEARR